MALAVLCLLNITSYLLLTGFLEKKAEKLERQYISQQSEVRKAEQGGRSAESPLVVYARGTKDLQAFRKAIPAKSKLTGLIGEIFTLDAIPDPGWQIDSWTGTENANSNKVIMPPNNHSASVIYNTP